MYSPSYSIPAAQRADAILRLVHRFLERPEQIAADFTNPEAKLPDDELLHFEKVDCTAENIDTPEEIALGEQMRKDRQLFNEKTERMKEEAQSNDAGSRPLSPVPLLAPPTASEANAPHPMHGGTLRTPSSSRKKRARSVASHDGYSTPGSRNASPLHHPEAQEDMFGPVDPESLPTAQGASVPTTLPQPLGTAAESASSVYSDLDGFLQSESPTISLTQKLRHLLVAIKRLKRDGTAKRDPVYDSDDDLDLAPKELSERDCVSS